MIAPAKFAEYADSPAAFRRDLMVEAGARIAPLGEVLDPWQQSDFEVSDPGWMRAVGLRTEPAVQRVYLERPRGHSKTSDLAVMVSWALAFAPRMLRGYAAAADQDQAKLLRDAIAKLLRLNPWLGQILAVNRYAVFNIAESHPGRDSELTIISSDVGSSYGILPDFIVIDELSHWPGGDELWASLLSAAAKRSTCMLQVISNAGMGMGVSWQWNVREACRASANWHFSRLDGPVASWLSPADLAEQRRLLPPKAYNRLWLNAWQADVGDCLDLEDIEACVTLDGPWNGPCPEDSYACLDLGLRNDRSALVCLALNYEARRVRLLSCEGWAPPVRGGQVSLRTVRDACLDAYKRFGLMGIAYDPWQCELMAEELQSLGCKMYPKPFVPKFLDAMATALLSSFRNRTIDLFHDAALIRDLTRLSIIERQSGFKLQATRDHTGHCDRGTALAMGLAVAEQEMKHWLRMMKYEPPVPTRVVT